MINYVSRAASFASLAAAAAVLVLASSQATPAAAGDAAPGAVYAMTNDPTNNEVVVLDRHADGTLTPAGSFATGGRGSGTFENSANGLILGEQSPNNLNGGFHYLFATNAGSDSISVFRVRPGGLELVDVEPSNGDHPISVTVRKHILYVLNGGASNCSGGTPTITGFIVGSGGDLSPIPGSSRPVSGGSNSGCAQISFNPAGDVLVVTQRQADAIDTYLVDHSSGLTTGPIVNDTTGIGPFGFTFTQRGFLLTTENFGAAPLQGGVASYDVPADGVLVPLGPTERNGRSDTCWIVNTDNGKFAFVTNFQSGDISSFKVERDGTLTLLNPIAAVIGVGASDQTLSQNSRYLYARNALQGTISVFRVENDGSLTRVQDIAAVPPGGAAIGIAAK
ncbi:MAG TPA: beta-propeller fold lactonase family protein [Vicinamibacterales bacterium]|nr:beta-propeller fold lactonase family protein [Vicinamibacterales bacterium]